MNDIDLVNWVDETYNKIDLRKEISVVDEEEVRENDQLKTFSIELDVFQFSSLIVYLSLQSLVQSDDIVWRKSR